MTDKNPAPAPVSSAPKRDAFSAARHDLRTPINQIIGYGELLQEQAEEDGQSAYLPDLQKIVAAARRQLELVDLYLSPEAAARLAGSAGAAVNAPPSTDPGAQPPEPAPRPPPTEAAVSPGPTGDSGRVLVVDDNELNRDMLSRRLAGRGFVVQAAEHGARALELIASERFDLVLLDVMMPGISGLEVLKTVRQTRSMAELPVIMATARDGSEDVVEALRLGANDYVTKPLDFPVVLARVHTQLALKRQKDEIQRLAEDLEKRNRFIRGIFGRYLSDEVVESLFESPEGLKLGGEKRLVTIVMSDLRAFTALSERLDPEQVVRLLNRYLGRMTDIIIRHRGTIDEFLGDAILTIFGAPVSRPDDALRALACAVEMQLAMAEVNADNEREGLPRLEMGIGIHTGEVVVGNIGSQKRAKYGVVGPPVNLTGRIESYTVGGQILVSDAAVRAAGASVVSVGESITVRGKGAREPLQAFDLCGVGAPYELHLRRAEEPLAPLQTPLPIRFQVLEEKRIGESSIAALLLALSRTGAELAAEASLPPLSNLRLQLPREALHDADVSAPPLELYAKVMKVLGNERAKLVVRFTAVPPEAAALVEKLLPAPAVPAARTGSEQRIDR